MAIASHISGTPMVKGLAVQVGNPLLAWLPALVTLVVPVAAWGDVYKWTDAKGLTVFSDLLPKPSEKVKNFEVVAKSAPPETKARAQAVTPAEQALLARVEMLERQLQARQSAPPPPVTPPPTYSGYYPPAPQPLPPTTSYYNTGYYGNYYPGYYPSYAYPVVSSYSYAYPVRTYVGRPAFAAPHGGSFRGGGGHGGGGRGGRR